MLKTSELLELTDQDLIDLVQTDVVIRLAVRNPTDPDEETETDDETETEDLHPFQSVIAAGKLIEIQFSGDTGGAIAYMYTGSTQPDELRWDCHEYRADFTWTFKENREEDSGTSNR